MAQQQSLPIRTASPGEVIFSEGSMGNPFMYVIKEGSVEISITRGERKVVLSTLGRGQFFGEMALLSLVPGTGIEPVWLAPRDFKSLVSTNFTIRAREIARNGLSKRRKHWRRDPESNRGTRLCRNYTNH
jgi:CRP-like cAMP-binding protein